MEASGSCLCGKVRYSAALPGIVMNNCHCSRCRKATGAAFGTYFHVARSAFSWTSGEELIRHFRPDQGDPRPFCSGCGTRVPLLEPEGVIIPAGTLDSDPEMKPSVNIHARSKAPWSTIPAGIATFDDDAPDSFWEQFE